MCGPSVHKHVGVSVQALLRVYAPKSAQACVRTAEPRPKGNAVAELHGCGAANTCPACSVLRGPRPALPWMVATTDDVSRNYTGHNQFWWSCLLAAICQNTPHHSSE